MPFRPPTTKPTTTSRGGARAGGNPTAQHGQGLPAAAQQSLDIGAFMATMLQAQTDSQLAIAAASHTNMVAFHTAMVQASAASGGKDAWMTVAKTSILRACTGQVLAISFITLQVYKEMETEGATSETVGRILRRLLQPVQNTLYKLNILVTPHLVLTVKNLSFSANGNKTHSGCTKGITIFVVPWKTQDMMNKEEEEEQCYNLSTLKMVADVRKHISGCKVEPPSTLLGLIRLFNNYCHLLDVLFGPHCPHLVYTREICNALDYNEADLETRIMQKLCLHLLWQVHHDARQFFLSCEQWSSPAPAPRSNLAATVARLVDDCTIDMMLTCPEAKFLGGAAPARASMSLGSDPPRAKSTINRAIPAGCKRAVDVFNTAHPTMSLADLIKKGGIQYSSIRVGGRGDCTSFGLLGWCAGCPYHHVACNPSPEHQITISNALKAAVTALKKGVASA
jgi:hypothetical protein